MENTLSDLKEQITMFSYCNSKPTIHQWRVALQITQWRMETLLTSSHRFEEERKARLNELGGKNGQNKNRKRNAPC